MAFNPSGLHQEEAERIIESLRSGVPYGALAERLPMGRDRLLQMVSSRLGESAPAPLLVRANYGEGKTHFLQAVAGVAGAAGAVVSLAVISRETPLTNLEQLYRRLVAGLRVPNSVIGGLQPILERLRGRADEVVEALAAAAVPERLRLSLEAYLQDDLQYRDELLRDLSGHLVTSSRLKAILRDLWGGRRRFESYVASKDPMALFRMLGCLIRLAGYTGWVLLLDELELIGKTGLGARAKAYANLARLTTGPERPTHTLLVTALASNYYTDVLEEKQDAVRARTWLLQRNRVQEEALAEAGIAFLDQAEPLAPLLRNELLNLLEAIQTLHGMAYDWQPPPVDRLQAAVLRNVPGADARLRSRIRFAVQWLDLWFQYDREPEVVVWQVGEIDLTEDPETLGDSAEGVPSDGAVVRNRVF